MGGLGLEPPIWKGTLFVRVGSEPPWAARHGPSVLRGCLRVASAFIAVERERESRVLNPPPGSTDPARAATGCLCAIAGLAIVLFHPAPESS